VSGEVSCSTQACGGLRPTVTTVALSAVRETAEQIEMPFGVWIHGAEESTNMTLYQVKG